MIYGVGTDIVAVERIRRGLSRFGDAFAQRILSSDEWADWIDCNRRAHLLAKRFAAKEAFAKALGTGLRSPVTLDNIRISHDPLGRPAFIFEPPLQEVLAARGIGTAHLSISDERDVATAFVVLEIQS